ncbi:hypothetical protein ACHAWU_003231 [Discostella pseudostelligera]|uniref:PX domain-containing protein n=1 Tax=Discostella pseudostelligera TaxID=259834 RepID=A0ABD3N4K4_9STRA
MIYLPEEKWSPRYNSDFYTIRMSTWHYIRSEEELLLLNNNLALADNDDDVADGMTSVAKSSGEGSSTDATAHIIRRDGQQTTQIPKGNASSAATVTAVLSSSSSSVSTSTDTTIPHNEIEDNTNTKDHWYDSNDDGDDIHIHNNSNCKNALHPTMTTMPTPTQTCSFLGISKSSSRTSSACFCCHPGIAAINNNNTDCIKEKKRMNEQSRKKKESFPAVYYKIQVFFGRGGGANAMTGRKSMHVVYRRHSHFRALCQEMDTAVGRSSISSSGGTSGRRRNGSVSDLMMKCVHPKQYQPSPPLLVFDWIQSHHQLCKLAWLESKSLASSTSTTTSSSSGGEKINDYYHRRMLGLHLFLHTLLCRPECANNPSIEKFLGLCDGRW